MDRGDGVCRHFDDRQNRCEIYAIRPDICRIDRQYEINYRPLMSWEAFVELNLAACQSLQQSPKVDLHSGKEEADQVDRQT